jgi:hypothetical protein
MAKDSYHLQTNATRQKVIDTFTDMLYGKRSFMQRLLPRGLDRLHIKWKPTVVDTADSAAEITHAPLGDYNKTIGCVLAIRVSEGGAIKLWFDTYTSGIIVGNYTNSTLKACTKDLSTRLQAAGFLCS